MGLTPYKSQQFIVEAFDLELWCPVLQAKFHVPKLETLRELLGDMAKDDLALERGYSLEDTDLAAVAEKFELNFELKKLEGRQIDVCLRRLHKIDVAPYLVHTGYELPLLLDGRKKLAVMPFEYPPMTQDGEEQFDIWVAAGKLHKEVVLKPFKKSIGAFDGIRTVYYALKGEEWRIPAMKLIWKTAEQSGWDDSFERWEGMLYGYENWQIDWWMENRGKNE